MSNDNKCEIKKSKKKKIIPKDIPIIFVTDYE